MKFRFICAMAAVAVSVGACGGTPAPSGPARAQPPTANIKPPTSIGAGEGQLNMVLWDGYADKSWADPFTAQTGCKLNLHPAGSSDEMVSLMKDGGGGQWDLVSASGDADRSEERRVGKSVDLGGGRSMKKKRRQRRAD